MLYEKKRWILGLLFLLFIQLPCFSGGTPEAPKIIDKSGSQYLSPNGDGIKDEATIEFVVELYVKSNKDGYIPEAVVRITDSAGTAVREIMHREESDIGWFEGIFAGYKKFSKKGIMSWDGKDESGRLVPEGDYDFTLTVKDDSGKPIEVGLEKAFVVDITPPSVDKLVIDSPFSPNGDNNKDTLKISQDGSEEALWIGTIENRAGVVLREFKWEESRPADFEWDGIEDDDSLYSYAIYRYRLRGVDFAGNTADKLSETKIVLDNTETLVAMALDYSYFSPNGDGIQDAINITLTTEITEGVESWSMTLTESDGTVRKRFTEAEGLPTEFIFDGRGDDGTLLPEGEYTAMYSVRYTKGDDRVAQELVTIDNSAPEIEIDIKNQAFSPNGDGSQDRAEMYMQSNEIVTWKGEILDATRQSLIHSTGSEETTHLIVLDGLDPVSGLPVPEGSYYASVIFTDRAGNSTQEERELIVDLTPPEVVVSSDKSVFSPNNDGIDDTVTVTLRSSEPVSGWAKVIDPNGLEVITADVPWTEEGEIEIEGLHSPETPLINGEYTVEGELRDAAGNLALPEPLKIVRDDRPAPVRVTVGAGFSPNMDGENDVLRVKIDAPVKEGIKEWIVNIEDSAGNTVKSLSGSGDLPENVEWDGSVNGNVAPPGIYFASARVEYDNGNSSDGRSDKFIIDVTPPEVSLTSTSSPFIKTDGSVEGEAYITMQAEDENGVDGWSLNIVNQRGEIVRSFVGEGNPSDRILWRGDAERPISEEDKFVINVEVADAIGNTSTLSYPLSIDIVVYRKDNKLYLLVPNVIFGAYKHTLGSAGREMEKRNLSSIERVWEIFKKYSDYRLLLEGHALNIYRGNPPKEAAEEKILVPLTERRAETVKQALLKLGFEENRIDTMFFGGTRPIVSTTDRTIWWKNRRVEFIMLEP